jgi:hypothetical protein
MTATVDLAQLAALRCLRRGFGDVQVLEVVEHQPGRDPAPVQATQGELFDEDEAPSDGGSFSLSISSQRLSNSYRLSCSNCLSRSHRLSYPPHCGNRYSGLGALRGR